MSAFWEPATTTSRPHASVSSGTAPRLETASTTTSAPPSAATRASDCTSATTPVEVSECTRTTTSAPVSSSRERRSSGCGVSPQEYRSSWTSAPNALAIEHQRSPNAPAVTTSTRSPGESTLTIADSNAPEPEAVKTRTSLVVRQTSCSRASVRRMSARKSGPRWWITGAAPAASTSGGTGVGPGAIR
jgi:hypothetical protein